MDFNPIGNFFESVKERGLGNEFKLGLFASKAHGSSNVVNIVTNARVLLSGNFPKYTECHVAISATGYDIAATRSISPDNSSCCAGINIIA